MLASGLDEIEHDPATRLDTQSQPYASQADLIEDILATIQVRARAAEVHADLMARGDALFRSWPRAIEVAERRIEERILRTPSTLPLRLIRARFDLTPAEERVLWTLLAHEICPVARQLIRALGTEQTSDPSTDTIRRVIFGRTAQLEAWNTFAEDGPLRAFGFIVPMSGSDAPEHRQTWKLSRRVLALAHGDVVLDPGLAQVATRGRSARALHELEVGGDAIARLERAFDRQGLVICHGGAGSGRRSVLTAIAERRGLMLLEVRARSLSRDLDTAQEQLRAVARECQLLELVPLVRDLDALAGSPDALDRIELLEIELPGLVLATSSRPIARRWGNAPSVVELPPISGHQRSRLWRRALPMTPPDHCDLLATLYPLAPSLIEATGAAALEAAVGAAIDHDHIAGALRDVLDDRMAGLATRLHVSQTWDDLVLPDDQTLAIMELLARIRQRTRVYEDWGFGTKLGKGLGVSALFSGPPGTGKSMAAGLIARALNTQLYQVDLSKIVSKWIGETEKNLAALFDAAEAGHAILLFDEADALFGKRTDVKSSNDRHANQEVNFLLQRVEAFAGVCILTTNKDAAIDEAFRRRLSVHVRFAMPDVEERRRLWAALIPRQAPTEGELELDRLADRFVMSGGYIRNAVLRAAFLAADERGAINAKRLLRAAQLEYEALGKVIAST